MECLQLAAAEPVRLPQGELSAALAAAQASGDCAHLAKMLADVQRRRAAAREAVAVEWCREVCGALQALALCDLVGQ